MSMQQKNVKLVPINADVSVTKRKDHHRLKRGCTSLMHACQQGLADEIVKEIRSQVLLLLSDPINIYKNIDASVHINV